MNIERKLASIRRISEMHPIEGADAIEVAKIDGWSVVVAKKDNFKVSDFVIYCEIDSIMPETADFEFLRNKKFKIKTMRLRGQISQGIVFPINLLYNYLTEENAPIELEYHEEKHSHEHNITQFHPVEGVDVTAVIGVTKYEPPINLRFPGGGGFFPRGNFPAKMVKTDEERCLSENTLIESEDGIQTIKEICENKYKGKIRSLNVFTLEDNWVNILNHNIKRNNNDWYEIKTELGKTIILTENHKIFMPELKCFRNAKDLKINDKVFTKN